MTAALGHLPSSGEIVLAGEYEFEVEQVSGHAPHTVIGRRVTAGREAERT